MRAPLVYKSIGPLILTRQEALRRIWQIFGEEKGYSTGVQGRQARAFFAHSLRVATASLVPYGVLPNLVVGISSSSRRRLCLATCEDISTQVLLQRLDNNDLAFLELLSSLPCFGER